MRIEDIEAMRQVFPGWAALIKSHGPVRRVCMLDPDLAEEEIIRGLFPDSSFIRHGKSSWDISERAAPDGPFDLVVLCNVMLSAQEPDRWIANLCASAANVWVQDLTRAWRNGEAELSAETGDHMRYSHSGRGVKARVKSYDLAQLEDAKRLPGFHTYAGEPADGPRDCLKFLAWIVPAPAKPAKAKDERPPKREEPPARVVDPIEESPGIAELASAATAPDGVVVTPASGSAAPPRPARGGKKDG